MEKEESVLSLEGTRQTINETIHSSSRSSGSRSGSGSESLSSSSLSSSSLLSFGSRSSGSRSSGSGSGSGSLSSRQNHQKITTKKGENPEFRDTKFFLLFF